MSCDRCGESRTKGFKFCPYCGSTFSDELPMIPPEAAAEKREERTALKEIAFGLGLLITILLSIFLIVELVIAVCGFPWASGQLLDHDFVHTVILVTPYIVQLFTLSGAPLIVFYALLLIVTAICVILIFAKSVRPIMNMAKDRGEGAKNTPLFEMTVLFALMLAIEMVYINMVDTGASPIDDTPVWQNMFSLLNAAVWEEVITRLLIIGVPVAVFYLVLRKDKKQLKKALGGFNSFNPLVVFLIFLSSFIFAAAHITSGSWGLWKMLPTFFFGLITGYLFVKYGLYVTIAMHFLNDYMSSEAWLTGVELMPFTTGILIVACIASIPFIYVYGKKAVVFFRNGLDKF